MAMTINTNVVSINSQRNLSLSGNSLGTTMQRLSSGLRVNSAKDDAAGLAIAERMNAQSRGLAVAARNANDGISLAQTTEGALGKVGDMLQRMRELAVQSSNATNSADDRKALQAEVNQLRSEIDRVGKTTSFNGTKVLDGSFTGGVFQVGASAGDNITVGATTKATADGLGSATFGSSVASGNTSAITGFAAAVTSGLTITVDGNTHDLGSLKEASSESERLGQVVAAINSKSSDTGVTAFLTQGSNGAFTVDVRSSSEGAVTFGAGFTAAATGVVGSPTLAAYDVAATNVPYTDMNAAVTAITDGGAAPTGPQVAALQSAVAGLAADPILGKFADQWATQLAAVGTGNTDDTEAVELQTQIDAVIAKYDAAVTAKTAFDGSAKDLAAVQTYGAALQTLTGDTSFDFAAATDLTAALGALTKQEQAAGFSGLNVNGGLKTKGIADLDISTQAGAWDAMKQIDSAIDQVNAARGDLGALQTRFEKTVENIDIQNENITAARGRIVDADFATETANLSRAQILQQAGTAMVAQANQLPQQVLSLLR